MNPSDLRLGNFIYDNVGYVTRVYALTVEINNDDLTERYKPIQITEAWLLKFGFEYKEYENWYEKECGRKAMAICFDKEQDVVLTFCRFNIGMDWEDIDPNAKYEYVHQFQNLYHILMGAEPDEYDFTQKQNKMNEKTKTAFHAITQRKLREKHNLFIEISVDCTSEPKFCYSIRQYKDNKWINMLYPRTYSDLYCTYEDALEDGLQQMLKLIP